MAEREKSHRFKIEPIKLCLKYNPPILGVCYKISGKGPKRYLHQIKLSKMDLKNQSAEVLLEKIRKMERVFLNPKSISEGQILSCIEKMMGNNKLEDNKENLGRKPPTGNKLMPLKAPQGEKNSLKDRLIYHGMSDLPHMDNEEETKSPVGNPENIGFGAYSKLKDVHYKEDQKKSNYIAESVSAADKNKLHTNKDQHISPNKEEEIKHPGQAENKKEEADLFDMDLDELGSLDEKELSDIEANFSKDEAKDEGKSLDEVYQEMLEGIYIYIYIYIYIDGIEEGDKSVGDVGDCVEFQRVYVEELGQEVLMDPQGNLFDMEGNFIGQADGDEDEEEENGFDDTEDDKLQDYFDDKFE